MKLKNTIVKFLSRAVYRTMSRRVKRMIFWGSVIGYFKGVDVSAETLKKANSTLRLCDNASALALPVSCSEIVWQDNSVISNIEECLRNTTKAAMDSFLKSIPNWLRYADQDKISRDMDKFIKFNTTAA